MKNLLITTLFVLFSGILSAQTYDKIPQKSKNITTETKQKCWSLSATTGYINIPAPNLGNNVWGSLNLGYSKKNWNVTLWGGSNYWIEGKQPDLRLGVSTTYTFLKW